MLFVAPTDRPKRVLQTYIFDSSGGAARHSPRLSTAAAAASLAACCLPARL